MTNSANVRISSHRFTRSLVLTVEHDQYLLQVESEEGARKLLMCIQNVIYKLVNLKEIVLFIDSRLQYFLIR